MVEARNLEPLALFGGLNAEELWFLVDASIVHWLLLVLLPQWKHTPKLSLVTPMVLSVVYSLTLVSLAVFSEVEPDPEASFTSLKGVMVLFSDPSSMFAGWVHYLVFDGLVGRWIVMDSIERGASIPFHVLAVVPCLFFTLMSGPMGLLIYVVLIRTLLDEPESSTKKKD